MRSKPEAKNNPQSFSDPVVHELASQRTVVGFPVSLKTSQSQEACPKSKICGQCYDDEFCHAWADDVVACLFY